MELAELLAEESVLFCTGMKSKDELLVAMCRRAAACCRLDEDVVIAAIRDREELGSTGLGNGIAIPHGKIPGLTRVTAAFARLANPIDFDAVDDQPVDLVLMLLAPLGAGAEHLKALSRVARLLRTESLVAALRATDDPRRLHAILTAPISDSAAA